MSQLSSRSQMDTSQSNLSRHVVLIDTDIGDDIDDALALALALRSPEIELKGVTTVFGDTQKRAHLAAHILRVFRREDISVAAGQQMPLLLRHRPSGVPQAAILDTCVTTPELSPYSSPELIIQTAMAHQGHLTLLCLGPLTNVAIALTIEPHLFTAIRSIVMIGGTSSFPLPEWNVRSDAMAAQIVLAAGVPVTLLGWNVTKRCQLRESDIERLRYESSPQTRLLSQLIAVWQRHRPRWHPRQPYLHDPLAIAALCAPELFQFEEMTARVFTHGLFKGFMMPRIISGPLVHSAIDVQAEKAPEWIMRRLLDKMYHNR
jgi:purine nucleosidase